MFYYFLNLYFIIFSSSDAKIFEEMENNKFPRFFL